MQELDLPLSRSSWTEEELKDPKKLLEMTTLLNAQGEMANKLLDAQWEEKWRQDKVFMSQAYLQFKQDIM